MPWVSKDPGIGSGKSVLIAVCTLSYRHGGVKEVCYRRLAKSYMHWAKKKKKQEELVGGKPIGGDLIFLL